MSLYTSYFSSTFPEKFLIAKTGYVLPPPISGDWKENENRKSFEIIPDVWASVINAEGYAIIDRVPSNASKTLLNIKTTSGCRYNAVKRLRFLDRTLTLLTAFTSCYLIWMSAWPSMVALGERATAWANLTSLGLSMLLLAVSLLIYAGNFSVRAEKLNSTASKLNELYNDMRIKFPHIDEDKLDLIHKKYHEILSSCDYDHDDVDFYKYQLSTFGDNWQKYEERRKLYARIVFAKYYPIMIFAFVTFFVVFMVFYCSIYDLPSVPAPAPSPIP